MISNQILQATLDGLKAIARVDLAVTDPEGRTVVSTGEIPGLLRDAGEFAASDELERSFEDLIDENKVNGSIVIASGIEVYTPGTDTCYDDVFNKADDKMHARKKALKGSEAIR